MPTSNKTKTPRARVTKKTPKKQIPQSFFAWLWGLVRTHQIDFAYWGHGLILASCILLCTKGVLLITTGAAHQATLWRSVQRLIGWWGNDILYLFLIWLCAGTAMRLSYIWVKRAVLLIPFGLVILYAADMFAMTNLHSRFLISGVSFLSWENAGPFLIAGLWAIFSLGLLIYGCVLLSYAIAKSRSRRRIDHVVLSGLVIVVGLFIASFAVAQDSSYQKNILQLQYAGGQWAGSKPHASYESYFVDKKGSNKRPDIIVVFAESFSSIDSKLYGGSKNLLSGFDTIARDGTLYTNFISNGCTSDTAHIAFLQGVEPWETPSLTQDYLRYKSYSLALPAFLGQHGYQSTFVSTAPLGFLNQRAFLESTQFDNIVSSESFTSYPKYVFHAAADEAMYDKTEKLLLGDSSKPRFMMLETISSHKPYNAPNADTEEEAFGYSDTQLLAFYRKLQGMHYFDHGILIVVGDHRKMQAIGYDEIEKWGNGAYGKAVLAVVGKDIPANVKVDTPMQHRDMHYSIKHLVAPSRVTVNTMYNDMFGSYRGRDTAVRYCQYVDRQYVATRIDGTTWNVAPAQKNNMADYIRAARAFQFGDGVKSSGSVTSGSISTGTVAPGSSSLFPGLVRAAHQGSPRVAPPNSLEAFYAAKKEGAEAIEMDVSFTKDGFPIVMHGPDIGRTVCTKAAGKKNIRDYMLQEMKDTCKLYNGQVILTPQEVIEKTQNQFTRYFIDVKIDDDAQREFVPAMLQSLKKLGYTDRIMFSSNHADTNYILGSTRDIIAGWEIYDKKELGAAIDADHAFILLPESLANPDDIRDIIHAKKVPVVFTINKPQSLRLLYDRGVRYVITDDVAGIVQ